MKNFLSSAPHIQVVPVVLVYLSAGAQKITIPLKGKKWTPSVQGLF